MAFVWGNIAQTPPPPTATSWHSDGVWIRLLAPEAGSTRITSSEPAPATHTAPAPTATPRGQTQTEIFRRTRLVRGSICTRLRSTEFVTHTEPYPTETPKGPRPVGIGPPFRWAERGSTRLTESLR